MSMQLVGCTRWCSTNPPYAVKRSVYYACDVYICLFICGVFLRQLLCLVHLHKFRCYIRYIHLSKCTVIIKIKCLVAIASQKRTNFLQMWIHVIYVVLVLINAVREDHLIILVSISKFGVTLLFLQALIALIALDVNDE